MKKFSYLLPILMLFLFGGITLVQAQKKEKIKGSKIVTTEIKELENFEAIEVDEKLEITLVPGDKPQLEIEADDNLQEIFQFEIVNKTLRIRTNKEASGAKKVAIRIQYTPEFKLLIAKGQVTFKALAEITVPELTVKTSTNAKVFMNAKVDQFTLVMEEKSMMELNLKASETLLELNKNATLQALIYSKNMKADFYQKANAVLEGDLENLNLRLDNSVEFIGKKLTSKNIYLKTDNVVNCSVMALEKLSLEVAGRSEVSIYGNPAIEIIKFGDDAVLRKKSK
ncbi:MAG: GIN domain-containing protein [Flavobacterium sp.]